MYYEWGISGALRECYARTGVAERLQQALLLLPNNLSFVIWDTWRPVQVQTTLYSDYRFRLKQLHPEWGEEQLNKETVKFVSKPSSEPTHPSPHLTGGAIDLSLINDKGESLEMGTDFDAFGDEAQTRYFEILLERGKNLPPKEQLALENRRILFHALTSVGFTNYSEEWWHYDFGDQFWGRIRNQHAIYGPTAPAIP